MLDIILNITLPIFSSPFGIFAYPVGLIATFTMLLWVPIRMVYVIFSSFTNKKIKNKKAYICSVILIVISISPIVEFFLTSENGTSGLFLLIVCPVPLFIYLGFEYLRHKAYTLAIATDEVRDSSQDSIENNKTSPLIIIPFAALAFIISLMILSK